MRIHQVMVSGEDIGHSICCACDVGDFVVVAMMALMEAGEVAQVSGHLVQGDGPLLVPGDCSCIVIEGSEGELMEIEEESGHVSLCKYSSLLQITVHQVPGGIFGGDDVMLYVRWEGGSPHGRWLVLK